MIIYIDQNPEAEILLSYKGRIIWNEPVINCPNIPILEILRED